MPICESLQISLHSFFIKPLTTREKHFFLLLFTDFSVFLVLLAVTARGSQEIFSTLPGAWKVHCESWCFTALHLPGCPDQEFSFTFHHKVSGCFSTHVPLGLPPPRISLMHL